MTMTSHSCAPLLRRIRISAECAAIICRTSVLFGTSIHGQKATHDDFQLEPVGMLRLSRAWKRCLVTKRAPQRKFGRDILSAAEFFPVALETSHQCRNVCPARGGNLVKKRAS